MREFLFKIIITNVLLFGTANKYIYIFKEPKTDCSISVFATIQCVIQPKEEVARRGAQDERWDDTKIDIINNHTVWTTKMLSHAYHLWQIDFNPFAEL